MGESRPWQRTKRKDEPHVFHPLGSAPGADATCLHCAGWDTEPQHLGLRTDATEAAPLMLEALRDELNWLEGLTTAEITVSAAVAVGLNARRMALRAAIKAATGGAE